MDTVDLGYLLLTLGIDSTQYEKQLEDARKKAIAAANDIEANFAKSMGGNKFKTPNLNLVPEVDHSNLHALNKHLDLKGRHVKELNQEWRRSPLKVRFDDSELEFAEKSLNKYASQVDLVNNLGSNLKLKVDTSELDEASGKINNFSKAASSMPQSMGDRGVSRDSFPRMSNVGARPWGGPEYTMDDRGRARVPRGHPSGTGGQFLSMEQKKELGIDTGSDKLISDRDEIGRAHV